MNALIQRIKNLNKRQKAVLILSLLVTALLVVWLVIIFNSSTTINSPAIKNSNIETLEEEPRDVEDPISGVLYKRSEAELWNGHLPLGVMVENLVDVRPQSGLSRADLVYEALAEGGITRFLAIFYGEDATELGPVRSARSYFVDWSQEYKSLYAHIGGSPTSLDKLSNERIRTLTEERPYYFRKPDNGLGLEHTAFTSTKGLWEMASFKGYTADLSLKTWKFKEEATGSARPGSSSVSIDFGVNKDYSVKWVYDSEKNSYFRYSGKNLTMHTDRINNEQLNARNVIIMYSKHTNLDDEKGRLDIEVVGKGEAKVFLDGVEKDATWMKDSVKERTLFYDSDGREIEFNRGKTWIEVVPLGSSVVYN